MTRKVIILGSSRNDGDTRLIVDTLLKESNWDVVDLSDFDIGYFDYGHENQNDDYLELIERIIKDYDVLIFASPVYWYSMSGIMKVFFDRLTDLLTIKKELGRALRGKSMAAISSSNGGNLGDVYWLPFAKSAEYLGMKYIGNLHTLSDRNNDTILKEFVILVDSFDES